MEDAHSHGTTEADLRGFGMLSLVPLKIAGSFDDDDAIDKGNAKLVKKCESALEGQFVQLRGDWWVGCEDADKDKLFPVKILKFEKHYYWPTEKDWMMGACSVGELRPAASKVLRVKLTFMSRHIDHSR